ncbi:MAG TPA: glycosyltransferase family 4 protein [Fimbriimonadales bacterium]|nr:glycosyltransferase family 4 protein [Fimbriimonadales bacterium]
MRRTKEFVAEAVLAVVSTYVPRHCGIATFARDLVHAYYSVPKIRAKHGPIVAAISDHFGEFHYPKEVAYEIRKEVADDYRVAAEFLSRSHADVISIQHEYGIYGGADGELILELAHALRKPYTVTLHTVLSKPTPNQRRVLQELCDAATIVVTISKGAIPLLKDIYNIEVEKIVHIPHGAPDLPFTDPAYYQETLGLTGRWVLMTFGHLGPSKGIEMALHALAKLVKDIPDVTYLIVGATHPELLKREGEKYRESLIKLVEELNLQDHVQFVNRYLDDEELKQYIQGADIYISPYPGEEQISSGPLTYAVAAGKAIISTPYVAAKEMLSDNRGILTPFNDPDALAENLKTLIQDQLRRVRMRKAAYKYGRTLTWANIGKAYAALVNQIFQSGRAPARVFSFVGGKPAKIRWDYLKSLCDETGVFQHARYTIPDRSHGYTTDDNARTLIAGCHDYLLNGDSEIKELIPRTLSFLRYAYNPDNGRVRNFMSFERFWLEDMGSEDSHGRTVWATGYATAHAPKGYGQRAAFDLFHEILPVLNTFTSPRAWALAILGIDAYLTRFSGDLPVRRMGMTLTKKLLNLYEANRHYHQQNWVWVEDILAYDNARIPEAFIAASAWSELDGVLEAGLACAEWLFENCTNPENGHLSLIGNRGWWTRGKQKAQFDQQPVDAAAMVALAKRAYLVTNDKKWRERAEISFDWFLGKNDVGLPLVDEISGGCRDGITPLGINENMGAESTLSYLLASLDIASLYLSEKKEDIEEIGLLKVPNL